MIEKEPNTTFPEMNCKKCGIKVKPVSNGDISPIHGYKLSCPSCNSFVGWGGKRQIIKDENGIRQKSSQWSADRLNISVCELCRRDKSMLGPGTLEVHHKIPISDGGPDEPDNILIVCTACHKQIHFLQCYFNRHLSEYFKAVRHE